MSQINKLEQYWLDVLATLPSTQTLHGATITCYPKVPIPVLNHTTNINFKEDCTDLIAKVEQHFRSKQVPFTGFRITPLSQPSSIGLQLRNAGFKQEGDQSFMVFQKENVEENVNTAVSVKKVVTDTDVDVFGGLLLTNFEMPLAWKESCNDFTRACMRSGWQFYVGCIDGEPVGTCALFSSGGVGGIFDVGTLVDFRKRGVGAALTIHALKKSMEAGNIVHTLQAETGGGAERLYEKIGFKTEYKLQYYIKEAT
ncbi:MAG: GNAT family N-acetyltransferase [Candidatus Bathyarchaeota archaeon]|nr:GNAT family N-acetyltransferase [Candidatus Bathyarchaeota archaeon]